MDDVLQLSEGGAFGAPNCQATTKFINCSALHIFESAPLWAR